MQHNFQRGCLPAEIAGVFRSYFSQKIRSFLADTVQNIVNDPVTMIKSADKVVATVTNLGGNVFTQRRLDGSRRNILTQLFTTRLNSFFARESFDDLRQRTVNNNKWWHFTKTRTRYYAYLISFPLVTPALKSSPCAASCSFTTFRLDWFRCGSCRVFSPLDHLDCTFSNTESMLCSLSLQECFSTPCWQRSGGLASTINLCQQSLHMNAEATFLSMKETTHA